MISHLQFKYVYFVFVIKMNKNYLKHAIIVVSMSVKVYQLRSASWELLKWNNHRNSESFL